MKTNLIFTAGFLGFCLIFSCKDEKTICHAGSFAEFARNEQLTQSSFLESNQPMDDHAVYYSYDSFGRVRFGIGRTFTNICPLKLVHLVFSVQTTSNDQPLKFSIIGDAEWHYLLGGAASSLSAFQDTVISSTLYKSENEIDFKGVFEENEAVLEARIFVQFDPLNSFKEDSTYFVDHFQSLEIEADGDWYQ